MQRRTFCQYATSTFAIAPLLSSCKSTMHFDSPNHPQKNRPLIINALGELGNPNLNLDRDPMQGSAHNELDWDSRAAQDALASGLSAVNITLGYVAGDFEPYEYTLNEIKHWDQKIEHNSDRMMKVLTANDITSAHKNRKIGVIFGFQNAAMMGEDADRVATFASMGVRIVQLSYNGANQLGDGSMEVSNRGLTPFGHEVVAQLNHHNLLVDLSHSGEALCLDALAASTAPITISHTGCRALCDLPRNKTDRELRLLADKGGVVGIYFMPFLREQVQPTVEDLLNHIEHAVKVCGEDHVGIGTDTTITKIDDMAEYKEYLKREIAMRRKLGISATGESTKIVPFLPDISGPEQFHQLVDLLHQRGHSAARIEKILGLNFLRLMKEVWTA